jgi:hypothetical protein
VPDVLNMISNIETSMVPLPRFGLGACPRALAATTAIKSAVATPRPRTSTAVAAEQFFGQRSAHATAGAIAGAAGWGTGAAKRLSEPQAMHTTLISAYGDGELGPHPAREPV